MRDWEREGTQTTIGKGAMASKQTKFFCLAMGSGTQMDSGGRQVHPDQKKVVEGQNSKIQLRQAL